jgi:hypothetical protein
MLVIALLGVWRLPVQHASWDSASSTSCMHLYKQPHCVSNNVLNCTARRAAKTVKLTLLPRRRGQYKLCLHLRGTSMPQLPRLPGMRSASAGGCSSIAASTAAATAAAAAAAAPGLVAVAASSPGSAAAAVGCGAAAVNSTGHSRSWSAVDSLTGSSVDMAAGSPAAGGADVPGCAAASCLASKPPLATVSVTAVASFPSLLVTDVFCQGLPKQVRKRHTTPVAAVASAAGTLLPQQHLTLQLLRAYSDLATLVCCAVLGFNPKQSIL